MSLVLARLVALAHFAFVIFLVIGGPLAVRWRRLLPFHSAVVAITVIINRTGLDCPLTGLEKDLLRDSGRHAYRHGFIEHYLVEPIHSSGKGPGVTVVLIAVWAIPTIASYAYIFFTRSSRVDATVVG